jgi:hypothetical protein
VRNRARGGDREEKEEEENYLDEGHLGDEAQLRPESEKNEMTAAHGAPEEYCDLR